MLERAERPIIESLLWTDLYKLTMGKIAHELFPDVMARYEFINRGGTKFPKNYAQNLRNQTEMMADLDVKKSDSEYLERNCPYLGKDYINWFKDYHYDPEEVSIDQSDGELHLGIEGYWDRTIHWEVSLMTTISQLNFDMRDQAPDPYYLQRARDKGNRLRKADAKIIDFGTRRARSTEVHRNVLKELKDTAKPVSEGGVLLGTSNVALAKELDLNPSGTYAHELVMAMAALFGVNQANEKAMEVWAKTYLGLGGGEAYPKLGTALTDTYTTDVFLRSFNKFWANYFTNLRQDSGDPIKIGEKYVVHFKEIGVDPLTKGAVFSDGLDDLRTININNHFIKRINPLFGIGTFFTNDVGTEPLNMVIKLFAIRKASGSWIPTVKISDTPGKISGDRKTFNQIIEELGLDKQKAA